MREMNKKNEKNEMEEQNDGKPIAMNNDKHSI